MKLAITSLMLTVSLLAGCGPTVSTANTPPAGSIWFGHSFDTTTFAMTGRDSSFPANQPIALVAHFTRKSNGESFAIQISGDGYNGPMNGASIGSGNDVYGVVLPGLAFPVPGSVSVSVVDAGGNAVASGTVTVR